MRNTLSLFVPVALSLSACGSDAATSGSGKPSTPSHTTPASTPTDPTSSLPTLADGYTRFTAQTVTDIAPGDDVTHCQYVMAPFDHDMDVLDVQGAQSQYGHHGVAFAYTPPDGVELGSEVPCMMGSNEFSSAAPTAGGMPSMAALSGGAFLGAVGPIAGRPATLPAGVAFRLTKGQGIMLNLHYINTSTEPVNGDAYIDMKFVDVDPARLIAAIFLNLNGGFSVPPKAEVDSTADCVAKSDVNVIMMSNHMHEFGTHATTSVVHGDTGEVEVLRDDPTWTSDMQSNPTFTRWDVKSPFVLHAGDTIRTSCSWNNSTTGTLSFPREMCISAGFALATGDNPTAPACFNGLWLGAMP